MFDRAEIESALAPLVGLPLWKSNRAADLQTFQFGGRHTALLKHGPRAGQPVTHGDYALHIQCSWRIVGPAGIVVGRRDLYVVAGPDPDAEPPDWTWDKPGANRRDERIEAWLRDRTYTVESVAADTLGGCTLALSQDHSLTVFPDDSLVGEYWRLLRPETNDEHFVVTGAGIER